MTTTLHPNGAQSAESETNLNPFAPPVAVARSAGAEAENQRAIAEIQSAMVIAKRFPRDQVAAMDRILQAFTRQTLAATAMYQYARGGQDVTGPSIRAAETIAQCWGNVQFGIRELEQRRGESTVEAFAWDVEANTRSVKVFQVRHERHTRKGVTNLEDPRDIYELTANQGARRLRACILSVIPGDVVEAAMKQAETTLTTKVQVTPDLVKSLVEKFEQIGVPKHALEQRIQRRMDAITPALVVQLGKIYNSINDGMSQASDWFDLVPAETQAAPPQASRTEQVASKLGHALPEQSTAKGATEQPSMLQPEAKKK